METIKKSIAPTVLVIAGIMNAIVITIKNVVLNTSSQLTFDGYVYLLRSFSESAMYIMVAWTAKAYYTGSKELGRAVTGLRYSVYTFCGLYVLKGIAFLMPWLSGKGDMQLIVMGVIAVFLEVSVIVITCLLILDIMGAYLKAKAENAMTV